ncbi:vesicle transport SFT2B [Pelobates cultripes]|uniref:Vesicle transport protein n=1 Tax=Pelobates cultripes TaxID=61616 RepID=A0AAD1R220_PELCU|nr:vesicle transport SFT2B [Pelobates cultripes]
MEQRLVSEDGKNARAVLCQCCGCRVLSAGVATLAKRELLLPSMKTKTFPAESSAPELELLVEHWLVHDMFTFDNVGFSKDAIETHSLSWGTRIKGFIACFVFGIVCSILGTCLLWLSSNGTTLFAVFYTIGNVASLCSAAGENAAVGSRHGTAVCTPGSRSGTARHVYPRELKPREQKRHGTARHGTARHSTVCLVLTLCSALWWKIKGLALLFCILQFVAMTWYSISYIPFARDAVKKCFTMCIS